MNHTATPRIARSSRCVACLRLLGLWALAGSCNLAAARTAFDNTVSGASCKVLQQGSMFCSYKVGRDLEFSITSVGEPDAGISFLRSSIKGDYFARFGVAHGCIIVAQGEAHPHLATSEFAFVSPKSGRVYRTWEECQASGGGATGAK